MPKPATPMTVINDAAKKGVAIHRFRISKSQGDEIKGIEPVQRRDAALRRVLDMLLSR